MIGALRWWRSYPAQQVTSLRTRDLLTGHLLYVLLKLTAAITIFTAIGALFGAFESAWVLAAAPAAVLCGLAHAAPVAAFAITRRSEISIAAFYRFVILPLSLFSGAFFPIRQLPVVLEQLAYVTPLWHGVDLCRDLALEDASVGATAVHVAYLAAWWSRVRARAASLPPAVERVMIEQRVLPALPRRGRPVQALGASRHLIERNLIFFRGHLLVIIGGFFEALFYLLSIGVGISDLVGDVEGPGGRRLEYTEFVAPAMLAASAMNGAVMESFNIMAKLHLSKAYEAVLATPITIRDIAVGEITWPDARGSVLRRVPRCDGCAGSALVVVGGARPARRAAGRFHLRRPRPRGRLGDPGLAGLRVGDDGGAADVPVLGDVRAALGLPRRDRLARPSDAALPRYRCCRGLTTGVVDAMMLVHLAYLVAVGVAAFVFATRRLEKRTC